MVGACYATLAAASVAVARAAAVDGGGDDLGPEHFTRRNKDTLLIAA